MRFFGLIAWAGVAGAQQNDYGGYDIVGTLESTEHAYGSARGWTVSAAKDRGRLAYCVGAYNENGYTIRIGCDGGSGKHTELTSRTAYYSFPLTGTAAQSPPQQPAKPPRSLQGRGEANCFTKTWGPYRCRITDLAPEQGYHRATRIDSIDFPTAQGFLAVSQELV